MKTSIKDLDFEDIRAKVQKLLADNTEEYDLDDIIIISDNEDKKIKAVTPEGVYIVGLEYDVNKWFVDYETDLIDDLGLKAFSIDYGQDYVKDNFLTWDNGEETFEEDYKDWLNGLEDEEPVKNPQYKNRMQEELAPYSDKDLTDYLADFEDDKEELIEKYLEHKKDDYDHDYVSWYKDEFGILPPKDELDYDIEGICEWLLSEQSYGYYLNSLNGEQISDDELYLFLDSHEDLTNEYRDVENER